MVHSDELRFRAGDASLGGTLVLPDGEGRRPWAVLLPSWLPRDRDGRWDRVRHPAWFAPPDGNETGLLERIADALAERGVASLRYDPRGCGESDGSWERTAFFTRIDDARDAIGAMRSRPELDLRRTAVVGHGEGAAIALSVAIGDPAIAAVGLVGAPARSLRTVLRRGVAARARTGIDRTHPIVAAVDRLSELLLERAQRREAEIILEVAGQEVGLAIAAWEQGIHTPTVALATMLHRDVVLLHGEDDAWVDAEESRLLVEALSAGGNAPSLSVLPGGHDLAEAPEAAIGAFADELIARIRPRELPPVLVAIEEMTGQDR